MKSLIAAVWFLVPAWAQIGIPIFQGSTINFLPPAIDASGATIAFGSTVTQQGNVQNTIDLYVGSVKMVPNVTSVGLARDGKRAVFVDTASTGEGIGILDLASGTVRRVNVDTQRCIRPLALCISCFFACVATPHVTSDGSKILFAVRENQPFFTVNSDATGLTQLPVYSGALAPAAQRVISAGGRAVFTSSAPFGPTFAASATDVYTMNLDGTGIKNLTNFGNDGSIFSANAVISADGATIVFETNYAGANNKPAQEMQIWAVQSDGSSLRQLTFGPGAATTPSISGDGKTGVYVQGGLISLLQPFTNVQPPGLRISIAVMRYSAAQSAVISEDGSRVAFLIGPLGGSAAGAVYQVSSGGSDLRPVYAPRAISPRGVVSAAGLAAPPSPGGLISVYGINFSGDSIVNASGFPLPPVLAGASVLASGSQIPMLSVSPWQITAQLPQEAAVQSTKFQASFADAVVTPAEAAEVSASAPALFFAPISQGVNTIYQAAAFHAGTAIPADDDHPAQAGEILEMYGTGIGVTDPMVGAGQPSPLSPPAQARVQPVVRIGNIEAKVLFAGLTPGLAGVAQMNVVVPSGLKAGRNVITFGNGSVGTLGTIAVR